MRFQRSLVAAAACAAATFLPAAASAFNASAGSPAAPSTTELAASAAPHDAGIAWRQAASDADVDAAFAAAKAANKPVFVYWGAKWCPPCNQVKATLFNRQDFIERSKAFVPVYVDGDSPGAQKIGARFKVSGYPTMVLFNPQGAELTRLPGEVEPERYTQVLTLGMNAQRPVKDVLAQAKAGGKGLTPNDWRLLAFYSWDTDEQQLVPKDGTGAVLKQLAAACPADLADVQTRLHLKALAEADGKGKPDAAGKAVLLKVLADPAAARAQADVLTNTSAELTRATTAKGARADVAAAYDAALQRLAADTTLSRADRSSALIARVDLARVDVAKPAKGAPPVKVALPASLIADIRARVAADDKEITNGYERQAVITSDAYLLTDAGLDGESDALLKANLAKSHSPYYLMLALASNAKQRGDKTEALHWAEEAYAKSEGPATRLQWGAGYVGALVEMAPTDDARIEQAASQVLAEAAKMPDAFYERSGHSLQRIGKRLLDWNKGGAHSATVKRLETQLDGVCKRLPAGDPQRATCEGVFKPAAKQSA
ncbi:MAG: thioredoxin family protein [Proteobacteria bacterium]|nr:thioredoxin family protein [Pseudomonadota bacterium]